VLPVRRPIVRIRATTTSSTAASGGRRPLRKEMEAHWALTHMSLPGWRWTRRRSDSFARMAGSVCGARLGVRVVLWKNDPCGRAGHSVPRSSSRRQHPSFR